MEQDNNYVRIAVKNDVFEKLKAHKLKIQAKLGRDITWDEFLLDYWRKG